jgi:hypothetical protein
MLVNRRTPTKPAPERTTWWQRLWYRIWHPFERRHKLAPAKVVEDAENGVGWS